MLESYPKPDLLKLIDALEETEILEELELRVHLRDILRKEDEKSVFKAGM